MMQFLERFLEKKALQQQHYNVQIDNKFHDGHYQIPTANCGYHHF